MTTADLKIGTKIFHRMHRKNGKVANAPRAHSTVVRCILEGNSTPNYYDLVDLDLVLEDGGHSPGQITEAPPQTVESVAPPAPPARVEVARPQADAHQGELTLARLRKLRAEVRDGLDLLDASIRKIEIQQAVREAISTVRFEGDTGERAGAAALAVRLSRQMRDGNRP